MELTCVNLIPSEIFEQATKADILFLNHVACVAVMSGSNRIRISNIALMKRTRQSDPRNHARQKRKVLNKSWLIEAKRGGWNDGSSEYIIPWLSEETLRKQKATRRGGYCQNDRVLIPPSKDSKESLSVPKGTDQSKPRFRYRKKLGRKALPMTPDLIEATAEVNSQGMVSANKSEWTKAGLRPHNPIAYARKYKDLILERKKYRLEMKAKFEAQEVSRKIEIEAEPVIDNETTLATMNKLGIKTKFWGTNDTHDGTKTTGELGLQSVPVRGQVSNYDREEKSEAETSDRLGSVSTQSQDGRSARPHGEDLESRTSTAQFNLRSIEHGTNRISTASELAKRKEKMLRDYAAFVETEKTTKEESRGHT